jgi:Mg2+/Co2+ transporter CorB
LDLLKSHSAQFLGLVVLLLLAAFFSLSETAMMAASRMRLRHLARQGNRAARRAIGLLERTDRLLSMVLLGNTVLNTVVTWLFLLVIEQFVTDHWLLLAAPFAVAFLILVFSEITPKIVGATYPERIALPASLVLKPMLWLATPALWFVNLFVQLLLKMLRVKPRPTGEAPRLTADELRTVVLEGSSFIPGKHRSMLLNLFDMERLTVDDVMAPRARIEALDLSQPPMTLGAAIATTYHSKLPVYEDDISRVVGILHLRKLFAISRSEGPRELGSGGVDAETIRSVLLPPYFIPTGTPLIQQLQMFQDNRQRLGLVVDEYGELLGLVTVEDIVEEIVGEFTTAAPVAGGSLRWNAEGQIVVDGSVSLRMLNRRLGLTLPLDGPKTLNGFLLETLEQLPDGPCSLRAGRCVIEVMQVQGQAVRSARLIRLV